MNIYGIRTVGSRWHIPDFWRSTILLQIWEVARGIDLRRGRNALSRLLCKVMIMQINRGGSACRVYQDVRVKNVIKLSKDLAERFTVIPA